MEQSLSLLVFYVLPLIVLIFLIESKKVTFPALETSQYLKNIDIKFIIIALGIFDFIISILIVDILYRQGLISGYILYVLSPIIYLIFFYGSYFLALAKIKNKADLKELSIYIMIVVAALSVSSLFRSQLTFEEVSTFSVLINILFPFIVIIILHYYLSSKILDDESIGSYFEPIKNQLPSEQETQSTISEFQQYVPPQQPIMHENTDLLLQKDYDKLSFDELIKEKNRLKSIIDKLEGKKDSVKQSMYFKLMAEYSEKLEQINNIMEAGDGESGK